MRPSFIQRGLAVIGTSLIVGCVVPVAHADEVDELIKAMGEVSQQASAQNEKVKELEDKVAAAQQGAEERKAQAAGATQEADVALAAEREARQQVNSVAGTRYRSTASSQEISVLGAKNPQTALDRSAFLATLGRQAKAAVDELEKATARADRERDAAARAKAEADFRHKELEGSLKQLKKEQQDLDARVREITERVDRLSPEERARWEGKNKPVAPVLDPGAASGVVAAALSKLGSPYSWGAAGPDAFDCSGLMVWSYLQQGKTIPRTSQAQIAGGQSVAKSDLQPGDIVGFFPGVTHVGMYIGGGQIVHASDYGIPVQVVSVDSMPFAGASRY